MTQITPSKGTGGDQNNDHAYRPATTVIEHTPTKEQRIDQT
jgi:hypothetical protein